jgi:hypothetical protein
VEGVCGGVFIFFCNRFEAFVAATIMHDDNSLMLAPLVFLADYCSSLACTLFLPASFYGAQQTHARTTTTTTTTPSKK